MVTNSTNYPETWPGTAIIKSKHNAFNWRGAPSKIVNENASLFKHGTHSEAGIMYAAVTEPRLSPVQKVVEQLRKDRHGGAYSRARVK